MSEGDEDKLPEEGEEGEEGEEEGEGEGEEEEEEEEGEEPAETGSKDGEEGDEGSQEGSVSSSQKGSVTGSGKEGSRGSVGQFSEGSRSLSTDVELLSHEVRELKDFIGVQHERLFAVTTQRQLEVLPSAVLIIEEKELFLERLQNPDLIALLKQTFKRAERGSFSPRQYQEHTDYLEKLKNDCPKFETYLYEIGEALTNIEAFTSRMGDETPEEIIKYKGTLEERAEKLNSVNNLLIRFLIQESCQDSYVVEVDLARAYSLAQEQSDHIAKLIDYIKLQRDHMDPDCPAFGDWTLIRTEKEPLDNKVEERLKIVGQLETQYTNQEEDERDPNMGRLIRKHMEEILRSQSLYVQKLRNCILCQAPYVYEDDEIPDNTEMTAEGIYISKYVDEWLTFNGYELNNPSKEEAEQVLVKRLLEELETFIAELNSEIEELEAETTEEEENSREGLLEWLTSNDKRKEYLEKWVQELSDHLDTIDKNKQSVDRRVLYGEKKVFIPKKPKRMPKMSELGSVESLYLPDTVPEMKEFCKDLVQKYNCLFKVYLLRMNLNDEKRRQEKLREQIEQVIESKHARKRGIQYEMQLRSAYATIAQLQAMLKDNKKRATKRFEVLKTKLEAALEKTARLQDELLSFQSRITVKVDPAAAQRK